jgi:hypothetical protein
MIKLSFVSDILPGETLEQSPSTLIIRPFRINSKAYRCLLDIF